MSFNKLSSARACSTLAAILFAVCASAPTNYAQETASPQPARLSAISGTLFDVKEAVITNVVVTLVNRATKEVKKTVSSDEGRFLFEKLSDGFYDLTAETPNFKKHERPNIYLQHSDRQHFNLTLEVISCINIDPLPYDRPLEPVTSQVYTSLSRKYPPPASLKSRKTLRRKTRTR